MPAPAARECKITCEQNSGKPAPRAAVEEEAERQLQQHHLMIGNALHDRFPRLRVYHGPRLQVENGMHGMMKRLD